MTFNHPPTYHPNSSSSINLVEIKLPSPWLFYNVR